jgi:hypothetical protein
VSRVAILAHTTCVACHIAAVPPGQDKDKKDKKASSSAGGGVNVKRSKEAQLVGNYKKVIKKVCSHSHLVIQHSHHVIQK